MKALSALVATTVGLVMAPHVHADDYDKFTRITVNEPVQLPNLTLQPGSYTLKLIEASGNRHVVQVATDSGKGMAIILALPNYRLVPKDKTTIQYWETPAGQPRAIRAWFFPGDNYGQEFAYPKTVATQISAYNHTAVATIPDSTTARPSDLRTAPVENFADSNSRPTEPSSASAPAPEAQVQAAAVPYTPPAEPQVIAQAVPPPPAVTPVPAPAPNPPSIPDASSSTPTELPRTGSDLPLIGAIGALSLAGFLTMARKGGRA
jgi:hypothetical protein